MIGGPLGAALHFFPLQFGVEEEEGAKAVNMGTWLSHSSTISRLWVGQKRRFVFFHMCIILSL